MQRMTTIIQIVRKLEWSLVQEQSVAASNSLEAPHIPEEEAKALTTLKGRAGGVFGNAVGSGGICKKLFELGSSSPSQRDVDHSTLCGAIPPLSNLTGLHEDHGTLRVAILALFNLTALH
ncbi:hypothetical protein NDU88_004707 [Pleurodeles waltl]|uniref:Uncharacterized protein n=1 Tax=Pleurodeles waltl TaxID=8319 RepID=A0AAV7NN24_PLEWA|nr:hypothetical protein NDU88_004707 [Pleurodeles waltl]